MATAPPRSATFPANLDPVTVSLFTLLQYKAPPDPSIASLKMNSVDPPIDTRENMKWRAPARTCKRHDMKARRKGRVRMV